MLVPFTLARLATCPLRKSATGTQAKICRSARDTDGAGVSSTLGGVCCVVTERSERGYVRTPTGDTAYARTARGAHSDRRIALAISMVCLVKLQAYVEHRSEVRGGACEASTKGSRPDSFVICVPSASCAEAPSALRDPSSPSLASQALTAAPAWYSDSQRTLRSCGFPGASCIRPL